MSERVYLDWNATAPLRPEARAAVVAALDRAGNPSSVHAEGRAARGLVETAREAVAALVGAEPRNVVFTSGGTEANALALTPALTPALTLGAAEGRFDRLLVSAIEHASVRCGGRFPTNAVDIVPVTPAGLVDLEALAARLAALRTENAGFRLLVSLMHANNETGVVQPIAAAADLVHAAGGILHVDAVQSAGKIPCDINALGADLMSLSGHKLGGPQGTGALVARAALHVADPLLKGGGQERGFRAGTENVAAIAGFGAAAAAAARDLAADAPAMVALRDGLEAQVTAASPKTAVIGAGAPRLPNTSLLAHPGFKAETALIALDLAGVAVSSGAACSSGKVGASQVLAAMGVPPAIAAGAVRVSLGPTTTERDVTAFVGAWNGLVLRLSRGGCGIAA
ncbi:MAG: cysteine desulfurase [Rhodoplanes sp.]|uniref:cysteine desulfurase family protein n=1 Tax=Rhodoplanes sp. TaxID=1968906 RepID=UPI001805C5C8|nr:cysteine desulfurase family protein [Rhodoplanes sp.]NVO12677.1 cysteine desulfurase [Rhodoplanes sp.]